MKKILIILLTIAMALAFVACGGSGDSKDEAAKEEPAAAQEEPAVTETGVTGGEDTDSSPQKTDASIDAVAKAIGMEGEGETNLFEMIGAKDGKTYNDGSVELYQFDKASSEYKDIKANMTLYDGELKVSALNGVFILIFPDGEDANLIKAFNELQF